jgi:hypothetical protein
MSQSGGDRKMFVGPWPMVDHKLWDPSIRRPSRMTGNVLPDAVLRARKGARASLC